MQYAYEIKETAEEGMGLFTLEDIPAGACVWKCIFGGPGANATAFNEASCKHFLASAPTDAVNRFLDVAYGEHHCVVRTWDDSQFVNHSDTPNCGTPQSHLVERCSTELELDASGVCNSQHSYALRDIKAGEQLTEDYREYDHPDWFMDLIIQHQRYQIACGFYDIEQVWTPRKVGRTLVSLSDSSDSDDSSAPLKVEQEEGSGLTSSSSSPYSSCGSEQGFTTGDNSASLDSIDGHDDFKEKHHQ